jgi:hypothetical protein
MTNAPSTFALVAELIALFVALPLAFDAAIARGLRRWLFPGLWALAFVLVLRLRAAPGFDMSTHLTFHLPPTYAPWLWARMVLSIAAIGVFSRRLVGAAYLTLPRRMPWLWAAIAVLYPLLSVGPQAIVYRTYFLYRFAPLFGHGLAMNVAAAAAFSFAHVIFRNRVALLLTFVGGLMFANAELVSGSSLVGSVEHAAYGFAAFSFGLGRFLHLGTARGSAGPPAVGAG